VEYPTALTLKDNVSMNTYTKPQTPVGYYVYAYLRQDSKTPYYIGKGKGRRAWAKDHRLKLPIDYQRIIILESGLTELGALALERRYIRWYGRKDLGLGILRNMTDGGEGSINMGPEYRKKLSNSAKRRAPCSDETRRKLSEVKKGLKPNNFGKTYSSGPSLLKSISKQGKNHPMYGKTHSAEARAKISKAVKLRHASNRTIL
jgi:hypothetical protein